MPKLDWEEEGRRKLGVNEKSFEAWLSLAARAKTNRNKLKCVPCKKMLAAQIEVGLAEEIQMGFIVLQSGKHSFLQQNVWRKQMLRSSWSSWLCSGECCTERERRPGWGDEDHAGEKLCHPSQPHHQCHRQPHHHHHHHHHLQHCHHWPNWKHRGEPIWKQCLLMLF